MRLGAEIREGLRISWGAIWAHKMRSGLTTLGIVIGVLTVTLMGTAIEGLYRAFLQSISMLGTDVLYVQKFPWFNTEPWWRMRNRRELTMGDARAIASQATLIAAVSTEAFISQKVTYANRTAPSVIIAGNNEDSAMVRGLSIAQGRFFTAAEVDGLRPVCVLGASVATNFFPFGSALGEKIKINQVSYQVIGVIDSMGQFLGEVNLDNQVIIPVTRLRTDFAWEPELMIAVKVKDIESIEEAKFELRSILRQRRGVAPGKPDDFAINEQRAFIQTFQRVGGTIAAVGLFITGLSLFVGGIGIMNIMFVSVAERTREIGIRKALGARQRTILLQFLIEAAAICFFGGLLAVGLAWPLSLAVGKVLPTTLSIPVVAIALLVAISTGIVSGFFPASRAARMNPVEALRKE